MYKILFYLQGQISPNVTKMLQNLVANYHVDNAYKQINGLVQDYSNTIVNTLELL